MNWKAQRILLFTALASLCHADIDWGGGGVKFETAQGSTVSDGNGIAVLVSAPEGSLMDFAVNLPANPADLLTPGAVYSFSGGRNRVLATSTLFTSGFLLATAVPDLPTGDQSAFGASPGEPLFLLVWDASTFANGLPAQGSRFITFPLYADGSDTTPAITYGRDAPAPATVAVPDTLITLGSIDGFAGPPVSALGGTAGFRAYIEALQTGETDPARIGAMGDLDGDGHDNLTEYAFGTDLTQISDLPVPVINLASGSGSPGVDLHARLRGDDPDLTFSIHASAGTESWNAYLLTFDGAIWNAPDTRFNLLSADDLGNGLWRLHLRDTNAVTGPAFYRLTATAE